MKRYLIFLFACILSAQRAELQPFTDIAGVQYQYQLPTQVNGASSDDNRSLDIMTGELLVPLAIGNGSYLLSGAQYNRMTFHEENSPGDRHANTFHVLELRAGVFYQWKASLHQTLILALPKWSADQPTFRSEGFQIGGVVVHTYRLHNRLALKGGLYYNREFFGNFFMPLLGVDWRIKDNIWLYGVMPGNLQLHHEVNNRFAVSLSYASPSGSLLSGETGDYIRIGKSFPPHSHFSADAHLTVARPIVLKVSVGHTVWRHYGAYDATNEQVSSSTYPDYQDGLFITGRILVRIRDKEDMQE